MAHNDSSSGNLFSYLDEQSEEEVYVMPISMIVYGCFFYSLIFVGGVFGNLTVIYCLRKEKDLRNFTTYLLANLSFADLMVLFTCVPSGLHDIFAKERWYLGKIWCYLAYFTENTTGLASLLSIFCITVERYLAICQPLHIKSLMTQSTTLKLIFFTWFVSVTVNLPFLYLTEYARFSDNQTNEYECICNINWTLVFSWSSWSFYYLFVTTFVFYVLIGIVLVTFYSLIRVHLKKSTFYLKSLNKNTTPENREDECSYLQRMSMVDGSFSKSKNSRDSAAAAAELDRSRSPSYLLDNGNNNQQQFNRLVKQRKQLILMLICVLVSFYTCLFPLKIWNLYVIYGSFRIDALFLKKMGFKKFWLINITVRIFFYASSCVNPLLYNFFSKKFRNSFKKNVIYKLCPH